MRYIIGTCCATGMPILPHDAAKHNRRQNVIVAIYFAHPLFEAIIVQDVRLDTIS